MLAQLVEQLLKEKEPMGGKIVNPICPKCKTRPRALNKISGCLTSYCSECRRVRNRDYKK